MERSGITILVIACFALLALAYGVFLLVRRFWLNCTGTLFDCGIRVVGSKPRWQIGLARYSGESLLWYPIWRPRLRHKYRIPRPRARMVKHQEASERESRLIFALTAEVVTIVVGDQMTYQLVLDRGATTGLLSWLEAAPPSQLDYRDRYVD